MNPVPATLDMLPARILGGWGGRRLLRTSEWAYTALAKLQGAILDLLVATHCPALHHLQVHKELS